MRGKVNMNHTTLNLIDGEEVLICGCGCGYGAPIVLDYKYDWLHRLRVSFITEPNHSSSWFFLFRVTHYLELTKDCTVSYSAEQMLQLTGYEPGASTSKLIGPPDDKA